MLLVYNLRNDTGMCEDVNPPRFHFPGNDLQEKWLSSHLSRTYTLPPGVLPHLLACLPSSRSVQSLSRFRPSRPVEALPQTVRRLPAPT